MKMVKSRLRKRLSDNLMRIAIEGPEFESVNFEGTLDIFKEAYLALNPTLYFIPALLCIVY